MMRYLNIAFSPPTGGTAIALVSCKAGEPNELLENIAYFRAVLRPPGCRLLDAYLACRDVLNTNCLRQSPRARRRCGVCCQSRLGLLPVERESPVRAFADHERLKFGGRGVSTFSARKDFQPFPPRQFMQRIGDHAHDVPLVPDEQVKQRNGRIRPRHMFGSRSISLTGFEFCCIMRRIGHGLAFGSTIEAIA